MSDIIFAYRIPDTNWLNPVWARYERKRLRNLEWFSKVQLIEEKYPDISCYKKAKMLGISSSYYSYLKSKMKGEEK